ncbi:LytR/AlgR family response regulator transcription factor [Autumnicola psychrophila]|uniref:LytTR family DNA-binding domain-containing protein n=1 Tax=Autumnicola psychrophila TaxID=3075592 RepID=A0ABU3DVP5_9FLAO|nr:LytTR family DNA-binding domain-containing protein [Zunongwangia sp. F225]MDT0687780.1 LytTR family DNA-binding domain-containing protein [Zunongwangia sp. F225]
MKRAILVDDEKHCIKVLKILLADFEDIKICATASTVVEAYDAIHTYQPDIVFLDIQLEEENSFDLLDKLSEFYFHIIFTTAYNDYAVKAFRYSAIDYLLKPIDRQQLKNAIARTNELNKYHNLSQQLEALKTNINIMNPDLHKIAVPTADGLLLIEIDNIIKCEAHSNYTDIFLCDGKKITMTKTLKQVEELLKKRNFFRVHQSYLVNLKYVYRYYKGKGGYVELENGSTVNVAVRKKEELIKILTQQ